MTKRKLGILLTAAACAALVSAGSPRPAAAEPPVLISSYTLIESSVSDGIDTRSYGLEVRNAGAETLISVRAILRKVPAYITVLDPEVQFGPVGAGETVMGGDGFIITVDTSQVEPSTADVGFIWEIITEDSYGWNEFPLSAQLGVLEAY